MRKFNITVNGTSYEVEVEEVTAEAQAAPAPAPKAPAKPEPKKVVISKPAAKPAPKAAAPAPAAGDHEILAPMPGKIVNVAVSVGQTIAKGDTVAILEAMKMQNEIKADAAGTVKAVNVEAGASVKMKEVLVVLG